MMKKLIQSILFLFFILTSIQAKAAESFSEWISKDSLKNGWEKRHLRYDAVSKEMVDTTKTLNRYNQANIFVVTVDAEDRLKPWCTLLHGYPYSSMSWQKLIPRIRRNCRILAFDFPGFGASSKNVEFQLNYTTFQRADLLTALWKKFKIKKTHIISHDFAGMVTLEMSRRSQQANSLQSIQGITLLNSGYFAHNHQSTVFQNLLITENCGKRFVDFVLENSNLKTVFQHIFNIEISKIMHRRPTPEMLNAIWQGILYMPNDNPNQPGEFTSGQGLRAFLYTTKYMQEKKDNYKRWENYLFNPVAPTNFAWGTKDSQTNPFFLYGQPKKFREHTNSFIKGVTAKLCTLNSAEEFIAALTTTKQPVPPQLDDYPREDMTPGYWQLAKAYKMINEIPEDSDSFFHTLRSHQTFNQLTLIGFPSGHNPHIEDPEDVAEVVRYGLRSSCLKNCRRKK